MSQAQKFLRWKFVFQSLTPQSLINSDLVPALQGGPPES